MVHQPRQWAVGWVLRGMEKWIDSQANPLAVFEDWYQKNLNVATFEPTQVTLATVDGSGMPSARVVLLKQHDDRGFCFFTNYDSKKGQELVANPKAALVFHWEKPLHRQVRVRGLVEKMTYAESNDYFQSRGRGSQVGAWASPQSQEIAGREELQNLVSDVESRFSEGGIPCPENWGGFRLMPLHIEFWESREHRLHDRMIFSRTDLKEPWTSKRLAP